MQDKQWYQTPMEQIKCKPPFFFKKKKNENEKRNSGVKYPLKQENFNKNTNTRQNVKECFKDT